MLIRCKRRSHAGFVAGTTGPERICGVRPQSTETRRAQSDLRTRRVLAKALTHETGRSRYIQRLEVPATCYRFATRLSLKASKSGNNSSHQAWPSLVVQLEPPVFASVALTTIGALKPELMPLTLARST